MLQIVSGKFFTKDDRYIHEGKGVLHSNFSWIAPIKTCIGTLEPVEYAQDISLYVFNYTNQIEKGGILVRVGDAEIVDQFRLLCMFGLRSWFSQGRNEIEHLCRRSPVSGIDHFLPAHFVPRFFDLNVRGDHAEVERFVELVRKIIGLRRDVYLAVMSCLNSIRNALQAISYNIDLAYSMLVYCLESLCQRLDGFQPEWTDYDERMRRGLDPLLQSIDSDIARQIQDVLLSSPAVQLQKRFIRFAVKHIGDSYYREDSSGLHSAVRPSQIERALKNAYFMRSKFTHVLEPIREQLRIPKIAEGDTFCWANDPYLTFSGMLRLTLSVLRNFIEGSDYIEKEEVNWRGQLPGIVMAELAPEYWICQSEGFTGQSAHQRLSGFLEHVSLMLGTQKPLPNMAKILEKIEALLPQVKPEEKIPMLAIYWLFNAMVVPEGRRARWQELLESHMSILEACCIEMMVVRLILSLELPWSLDECITEYNAYSKHRYAKTSTKIPTLMEIGLLCSLVNTALRAKDVPKRDSLIAAAIGEAAGRRDIQKHLSSALAENREIDIAFIMTGIKTPAPTDSSATNQSTGESQGP